MKRILAVTVLIVLMTVLIHTHRSDSLTDFRSQVLEQAETEVVLNPFAEGYDLKSRMIL